MKVLIITPKIWMSGVVTFARELQAGWPSKWPRPVIATVTRSGRLSTRWGRPIEEIRRADATSYTPDFYGTPDALIHYARSFDVVHVNEADMPDNQREMWYDVIERLPVPFTLQLHGNRYTDVNWSRVVHAPTFSGLVWQTPGNVPDELTRSRRVTLVPLSRPWNLRQYVSQTSRPSDPPLVGFQGRLAPDKGPALVAGLAMHAGLAVCLHGVSQGVYPYALTLQCALFGREMVPAEAQWTCPVPGGWFVRYAGPYVDGVETARHHTVHVSATRQGFSGGTEYGILEAVDAGCRVVQPEHMVEPDSPLKTWTYEWNNRGAVGALRDPLPALNEAVLAALGDVSHDPVTNRVAAAQYHSPARLAHKFFSQVVG